MKATWLSPNDDRRAGDRQSVRLDRPWCCGRRTARPTGRCLTNSVTRRGSAVSGGLRVGSVAGVAAAGPPSSRLPVVRSSLAMVGLRGRSPRPTSCEATAPPGAVFDRCPSYVDA